MIQKHNSNDMNLKLFFVLLSLIFCGCSEGTFSPQNFYKVKKTMFSSFMLKRMTVYIKYILITMASENRIL